MRVRGIAVAVLAGVVVSGSAVGGCAPAAPPDTAPPVEEDYGVLAPFYEQTLRWESCARFPVGGGQEVRADDGRFQCAQLEAPLDYAEPGGATVQVAVVKLAAGGQGSLVVNPGGPGASGLEWALTEASAVARGPLGSKFDVVSFDPRGVGASLPRIDCLGDSQTDARRAADTGGRDPAGITAAERADQEFVDACAANTGLEALANMGTRDVARDLDLLRAALGEAQLTYVGFSYGTLLGAVYAEQFPSRVRAMVLDGAVDPGADPAAELIAQGTAFQQAFDAFAQDCAAVSDCALGPNPDRATAQYRELIAPLLEKPAATTDPRGLSHDDAVTGTIQALYSTSLWGALRAGLGQLAQGRGDSLLLLADIYEGRGDDGRYASNISSAFDVIRCVDAAPGLDPAQAGALDQAYRAAAPFLDDGRGTGAAPRELCDRWPVPATLGTQPAQVPGLARTVVVSTTRDPATPYQVGVDLAAASGASLITVDGATHTAAFGNDCVDAALDAYLLELTAPVPGLVCGG